MYKTKEQQREVFLKLANEFFEKNGKVLNGENGKALPKDPNFKFSTDDKAEYSINIYGLTESGIRAMYYRGLHPRTQEPVFVVVGMDTHDIPMEQAGMLCNKYITFRQLQKLTKIPGIRHLKVK